MRQGAASKDDEGKRAHFVFIPLMAQGHILPSIDTALLLATRGALCTIIATPATAARVRPTIEQSGLHLDVRLAEFPLEYVADGADNIDNIPPERFLGYFPAVALLGGPVEEYLRTQAPRVTCIVSDFCHPWTSALAASLAVPRLSFVPTSAFSMLCEHNMEELKAYDRESDEAVVVPGTEGRFRLTRAQTPRFFRSPWWGTLGKEIDRAHAEGGGMIVNTFLELEPDHVRGLAAAWGKKVWSVGPVSLRHQLIPAPVVTRGDGGSSSSNECIQWLDGKEPGTVVYVSFGTLAKMEADQLLELGLGLELSGHTFIWVFNKADQFGEPLQELEARVGAGGNGLIVRGWAPQVLILSHSAVGGFLTHCGWNSVLEGIAAGKPMVTWPRLVNSDHHTNEKLVVEALGIGFSIAPTTNNKDIMVRREVFQAAVPSILGGGEEGEERRSRARALSHKARAAMQVGGSSHANLCDLANRFII